jgi:hypothetical protein
VAGIGIQSARRKFDRGRAHAEELRTAIDAFREQSPYEFKVRSQGNLPGKPDFRIRVKVAEAPSVPESWSLIFGDFLTNMRAALDHAVFPHVREHAPTVPAHRIQYPIFDASDAFEKKVDTWFSDEIRLLVEDSQPYHADDPSGHALRILRDLVNTDKHHTVVVTNYSVGDFEIESNDQYKVMSSPKVHKTAMVVGAVVAEAHLQLIREVRGTKMIEIANTIAYGETIEIPGIEGPAGLIQAVECILSAMGPHLDNLEAAGC